MARTDIWIALGAISAGIAVGLGAYGAHGLGEGSKAAEWVDKASRYQMIHGLALIGVGILAEKRRNTLISLAGVAFTLGTILFCGTLYAMAIAGLKTAFLAPYGGMSLMAGWLLLAFGGIKR